MAMEEIENLDGPEGLEQDQNEGALIPQGYDMVDLVEALLFSSSEPLTLERLAAGAGVEVSHAQEALAALEKTYEEQKRPLCLKCYGGRYRLLVKEDFHEAIARLKGIKRREGLSQAALETLAVVAYRQPIIRAQIEDIRGVKCGPMLRALLERKLIKVTGRAQVPGRPLLYGTTRIFLERFGIESLKELPSLREFKEGKT